MKKIGLFLVLTLYTYSGLFGAAAAVDVPCGPHIINQISGSPFPTEDVPIGTAFSPNERLLAVVSRINNTIRIFQVAIDGTLTKSVGSLFAAGNRIRDVAFSPNGAFLAALSQGNITIFRVTVDGTLTQVSSLPVAGTDPESIIFNPKGQSLAIVDFAINNVMTFRIAPNGTLTQIGTFAVPGSAPQDIAFSSNGQLLAVANKESVMLFRATPDGQLTSSEPPVTIKGGITRMAFSLDGTLLATVSEEADQLTMFRVELKARDKEAFALLLATRPDISADVAGVIAEYLPTLTAVAGSPFYVDGSPFDVSFSPDRKLLAVLRVDNVMIFRVKSDGILTAIGSFPADDGGISLFFSPSGKFLVVLNANQTVSLFCVRRNL